MTSAPLAGFTVGITADRRREELESLLVRRGARVVSAPAIRLVPLADDTELREATAACLEAPVDILVATTGIGFRGWMEAVQGWGLDDALHSALEKSLILCRGPKARGAVRAAGLVDAWAPESESSSEVLEYLLQRDLDGLRIVVQLHGEPLPDFVDALEAAGAFVVEIPVYRWTLPQDVTALERMIESIVRGELDAVTFTSALAVTSMLRVSTRMGLQPALLDALRNRVTACCVGPVTAAQLERLGVRTLVPERARLGALVRSIEDGLPRTCRSLPVAGHRLSVRGHAAVLNGVAIELPPSPMAVLRVLSQEPGRVVSRRDLLAALPEAADEHAVEMVVSRLRAALGDARIVQTVVKRGYRLAFDPEAAHGEVAAD